MSPLLIVGLFFLVMSIVRVTLSAHPMLAHVFFFFFLRLLTLRRQASPTETKIRGECSNMVNEALEIELRTMNPHPASDEAEDSEDVIPPPASTKAHAQA